MRLFFAYWPDADVASQLATVVSGLPLEWQARAVPSKNFHVTLVFLGEVASSRLELLRKIAAANRAFRYEMKFDRVEYWKVPRVLVATMREIPSAALAANQNIRNELITQGFQFSTEDREGFRPHVTLARKVAQVSVPAAMTPIFWRAHSLSLIRSETGGAESAYTVLDTWPLLYETQNP
jgi:RNA 2',3'-cyclic 3'-phosphodiesterase